MRLEEAIKSKTSYPLEKRVALNIILTANILGETFNEIIKPYDLSTEQFNVLRILRGQRGNPINMCDIQERMIARTSNTTRLVDKLLLKGFVTREICSENRRKMEIRITEKGLDVLTKLDPKVEEHERRFSANLEENEMQQLNSLLEKYRTINK